MERIVFLFLHMFQNFKSVQTVLLVERRVRRGVCVFNSKLFDKIGCQEVILGRNDYVVLKGNNLPLNDVKYYLTQAEFE